MIIATIAKERLLNRSLEIANNETNFTYGQAYN